MSHCSQCGRATEEVWVQDGYDAISGQPQYRRHMRCPKKVTSSWQAVLFGDWHDESVVPVYGPYQKGDPGPLGISIRWH